jgi:hypothetical protein
LVFFDDLIDPFYVKLDNTYADPSKYAQGQIFFADVPYSEEQKQYWRPSGYDKQTSTSATSFNIVQNAADLFKRNLPLYTPKLEVNEEFAVVRAKRRPVLLMALPGSGVLGKLAKHHLVVPRFGAVKGNSDQPKLPPDVMRRVRTLEYPDLLFSPSHPDVLTKDGIFANYLMQPIPLSRLEATQYALAPSVLKVFRCQILHRCFGIYNEEYAEWREMFLNQ